MSGVHWLPPETKSSFTIVGMKRKPTGALLMGMMAETGPLGAFE